MTAIQTVVPQTEPAEERVILRNVSWRTYECLLKDFEDSSSPRFAYDRGVLEIMSPLPRHEGDNINVAMVVEMVAMEWGIEVEPFGSTTFKRADLERGFEADSCFYIRNADRMKGRTEIDLMAGDPAPELVIEIDLTHSSLNKMPIYADMGVAEVWRFTESGGATIFLLEGGRYESADVSRCLPPLSVDALNEFLKLRGDLARSAWLRHIREWARRNSPSS